MESRDDFNERRLRIHRDPTCNIFAGAVGGLASVVVGHPFDTIKVRMQTMKGYSGVIDCTRKTVVNEGLSAFYRGMSGMFALALPRYALIFHANAVGKKLYGRLRHPENPKKVQKVQADVDFIEILFAGVFSQLLIVPLLVSPLERVKILMQTNRPVPHTSQVECIKYLVADFGVSSLYKGTILTYLRDCPGFAIYFLTYEVMRKKMMRKDGTVSSLGTLLSGGSAGVISWGFAVPFDTIKNRHQAVLEKGPSWETIRQLYAKEGVAGFYRGAVPIMVRAFPANAAAFLGYEAAISAIARISQ